MQITTSCYFLAGTINVSIVDNIVRRALTFIMPARKYIECEITPEFGFYASKIPYLGLQDLADQQLRLPLIQTTPILPRFKFILSMI